MIRMGKKWPPSVFRSCKERTIQGPPSTADNVRESIILCLFLVAGSYVLGDLESISLTLDWRAGFDERRKRLSTWKILNVGG